MVFSSSSSHLLRSVRETRPCRTNPLRRPWRYGRGRGCRTNSLLACIWPPKPGSGRIWAGRRFSPLKRPSAGQITLKRTFLRQNVIWPEKSIVETGTANPGLAEPIHRGDRYGKPRVCRTGLLPRRTFTRGLVRHRKPMLFCAEPAVSVSGFRFFCHGAQTFPVGLRGAAAFCGINCVKLRSATAPQSGYYF